MVSWTEKDPIVSIKDVHKSFGALEVLKGVSLDVMKGEVICIIGPSGSGKSTLIRCINALNDIQGVAFMSAALTSPTRISINWNCVKKSAWFFSNIICFRIKQPSKTL